MTKTLIRWALLCLTTPFACFPASALESSDSTTTLTLKEITVKAAPVIHKTDRTNYLPPSEKKRTATSGLDLLDKMQLPGISVNRLTGAINLSSGGKLKLLINGVEANNTEIAALRPSDIIRIEYHDIPGAKYNDADAVIDFITRRHESGGSIAAESMNALGSGKWAAFENIAAQFSHKASTFSLNAGYFGLYRDNWIRDYTETWNYPDHSVSRVEEGLPVEIGSHGTQVNLNYSLTKDRKYFLNIRANLDYSHTPNKEEGDRHTLLRTSDSENITEIIEHTQENELSPTIGIYYKYCFSQSSQLTANISGSYIHTNSHHSYSENYPDLTSIQLTSNVAGRQTTLRVESYYDRSFGVFNLSVGGRHMQGHTTNGYSGSTQGDNRLNQAETSIFASGNIRLGKWGILANLTATRFYISQHGKTHTKYSPLPSVGISYTPVPTIRLKYDMKINRKLPPLASMSDIEIDIQPGLIRRGNPDVKSFTVINQHLGAAWYSDLISANLSIDYRNEHKPVMAYTSYDGQQFITSYRNQRSFRELRTELSLTIHPWSNHFSITLAPTISRYYSHGYTYLHVRNIFHIGAALDFTYGNWTLNGNIMTGAANSMYGEEIISETDMNMILAGYKKQKWSIQAGVFNAFMKEYSMTSENMSALTPNHSKAWCGKNLYGVVKFSINLEFGRNKEINLPDWQTHETDTGILSGLK